MKRITTIGVLVSLLLFAQSIVAQNNSRRVVATHIKTENLTHEEHVFLMDINTYLHSAFENNGYAMVSFSKEDRELTNELELLNYIDANVRGANGEAIDYMFVIWLEHIGKEYKVCSKRNGRTNTDYKLGIPIDESEMLIGYRPICELIALEIVNQYVGALSQRNQVSLDKRRQEKAKIIEDLTKGPLTKKRKANAKALGLSIIPGVGLMQKGRTGEGVAYLIGDVALVGGGIGMLAYADKQLSIMNDRSTNYDQFIKAKSNYDTAKTASYFCFGTAAALYVVNLVRSYVAEPKPGARIQWAVVPAMNPTSIYGPNMSVNLAFAYKF